MNETNKKQTKVPWPKSFLTSILGTAIGVGLTFFVNNRVENSHQKAAQRETAIMAVCDIDEIVQGLRDEIQMEDSLFNVTMYVSTHQERIESLPMDTLDMAFKYLYDDPTVVKEWTADTKENAFNSGIDARMNLGNNQFYDNVQSCYHVRRTLMKVMADAPMFLRPVSKDAYEDFLCQLPTGAILYDGTPVPEAQRQLMEQVFAHESTTLYIKRYFSRKKVYQKAANELERLNRENKLLMDITDKDIEMYLKQNSNHAMPQNTASLILGKWLVNKDTVVFHEDNSLERTWVIEAQAQVCLDVEQKEVLVLIPTAIRTKGHWGLNGDTLKYDCNFSTAEMLSFDFDTSNFPQSALERLKDSLDIKKEMAKKDILEQMRKQTMKSEDVVSFDKSGSTMIWTSEETTPAGNKQTTSLQLSRIPE